MKKVSLEFISTSVGRSVGQACYGWLVKVTHFLSSWGLETNDLLKPLILQTLNNPINIFLINPNISYHIFSLNIYEYPKYHQHQCYHNQLKNHRNIM